MAQVGRISGPLLVANLERLGKTAGADQNLTFSDTAISSGGTPVLFVDVINSRIGINNNIPQYELDVTGTSRLSTTFNIDTQANIANLNFVNSSIQPFPGSLTLDSQSVITANNIQTNNLNIGFNRIQAITPNTNIELIPNGTGSVEVFANTNVYGNIDATGSITLAGNINFGDADTDNVTFNTDVASDIIPNLDGIYSLGTPAKRWQDIESVLMNGVEINTQVATVAGVDVNLAPGKTWFVAQNGDNTNVGDRQQGAFRTIEYALLQASAGDTVYVYPGEYEESCPLEVPTGVTITGHDQRNTIVYPASSQSTTDIFLLNGETLIQNLTIKDFYYDSVSDIGYAFRFATGGKVTTRSPYIQNITVLTKGSVLTSADPRGFDSGDAGKGILVDGSVLANDTREASMLFHAVTLITPGVDAITMTNGVRVEWLNSFTYFANRGLYATRGTGRVTDNLVTRYGAEIRSIGSANIYGNIGAEADGADTLMYLINHNWGYIGTGKDSSNDNTLAIQANEVIEINSGQIHFQSQAQDGDFRVGDNFLIDFAKGSQTFDINDVPVVGVEQITVTTGSDVTILDLDYIQTGNIRFIDNTVASITGDLNILSTTGTTNITTNVVADQNLYASGNLTIGGGLIAFGNNQAIDTVTFDSGIDSDLLPKTTDVHDIGSTVKQWRDVNLTEVYLDTLNITNNYIETIESNTNLELRANGTGEIFVDDSVTIENSLDVQGLATFQGNFAMTGGLTVNNITEVIGTLATQTSMSITDYLNVDGGIQSENILLDDNFITTTITNSNLELRASGSGVVSLFTNANIIQDLNVIGNIDATDVNTIVLTQSNSLNVNDISIQNATIQSSSNLILQGTQNIVSTSNVDIAQALTVTGVSTFDLVDPTDKVLITGLVTHTGDRNFTGSTIQQGNLFVGDNLTVTSDAQFEDISIKNNVVTTTLSNSDLELRAAGSSSVLINDSIEITNNFSVLGSTIVADINVTTQTDSPRFEISNVIIDDNFITTQSGDLILRSTAGSILSIPNNDVVIDNNFDSTSFTYFQGGVDLTGSLTHTGNKVQNGNVQLTGNFSISNTLTTDRKVSFENIDIEDNFITTVDSNSDLELRASGSGNVLFPSNNVVINNNLTIGLFTIDDNLQLDNATASEYTNNDILVDDNTITTTQSNADLTLRANGTGEIYVPSNNVQIDNNLDVSGLTDLQATIVNGTLTHVGDKTQGSTTTIPVTFNSIINRPPGLDTNFSVDYAFENMDKDNTGQYAIVGISNADSPFVTGGQWGVVHIIEISTGNVVQTIENPLNFSGTEVNRAGSYFGQGLSIHDDIAVISAPREDILDDQGNIVISATGVVYVFNWVTNTLLHTIEPTTPSSFLQFGIDVAFDGTVIAIGTGNPLGVEQWLWGGVGNPSSTLRNGSYTLPAGANYPIDGLRFSDLGEFNNHLFIGYRGGFSIHSSLTRQTLATHTDNNIHPQFHPFQRLSTDVFNGTLVVGAYNSSSSQTVYIVDLPNQTWTTLSSPAGTDSWGEGVGINQNFIIVGDPSDPQATAPGEGRVYVYDRNTLTLESIIDSSDNLPDVATNRASFGQNIILSKTTNDAIISAGGHDVGTTRREGVALSYTFRSTTTSPATVQITGNMTVSGLLDVPNMDFENVLIDTNVITTVDSNSDLELRAAGTGIVQFQKTLNVPNTTTIGTLESSTIDNTGTVLSNTFVALDDFTSEQITIQSNNITWTNGILALAAAGTGNIVFKNLRVEDNLDVSSPGITTLSDTEIDGSLTVLFDRTQTGNINQTGNLTINNSTASNGLVVDRQVQFENILIDDNIITTTDSNSNLELRANGNVVIPENVYIVNNFSGTTIDSDDIVNTGTITSGSIEVPSGITISGSQITTSTGDLTLSSSGTNVIEFNDNVSITDNMTSNLGFTYFSDTEINGDITSANRLQDGNYSITGRYTVDGFANFDRRSIISDIKIEGNQIITRGANQNLVIESPGNGLITSVFSNVQFGQDLTVLGTINANGIDNATLVDAEEFNTGLLKIFDNNIDSLGTNTNIILSAQTPTALVRFIDSVEINNNLTINEPTNIQQLQNVTVVGNITHTGNTLQTGNMSITGDINMSTLNSQSHAEFENIVIGFSSPTTIETTLSDSDLELVAPIGNNVIFDATTVNVTNGDLIVSQTLFSENIQNTGDITTATITTSDVEISTDTIKTTLSNSDLELYSNSSINFLDAVTFSQNLNVEALSQFVNVDITGTITHTDNATFNDVNVTGDLNVSQNATIAGEATFEGVKVGGNYISTFESNADLELQATGTGQVLFDTDTTIANNLAINGVFDINELTVENVTSAERFDNGNIQISDNRIQTTETNSNLHLETAGAGSVDFENININENVISSNSSITFTVDGSIDIHGTNAVKLPAGTDLQKTINTTGDIRFNTSSGLFEGFTTVPVSFSGIYSADRLTSVDATKNSNQIIFTVQGTQEAVIQQDNFFVNGIILPQLTINNNTIQVTQLDTDLTLSNGSGVFDIADITIEDSKIINNTNNALEIKNSGIGYYTVLASKTGVLVPSGPSADRTSIEAGDTRWNTDLQLLETFDGNSYVSSAGSTVAITPEEFDDLLFEYTLIFG